MQNKLPEENESASLRRRDLLHLASAALLGLTAARPHLIFAHGLTTVAQAQDWKPAFLNPHQNETVMALTEMILPRTDTPGANDAKVNRYLDLFLQSDNFIDKQQFLDGLAWLDQYSNRKYGQDFKDCRLDQQSALLELMSVSASSEIPDSGHAFFNQAKNMTSMIYFATAEGFRELNKYGPPPATVACEHPAH